MSGGDAASNCAQKSLSFDASMWVSSAHDGVIHAGTPFTRAAMKWKLDEIDTVPKALIQPSSAYHEVGWGVNETMRRN